MVQYIDKDALIAYIKACISDIKISQKAGFIKKRDANNRIIFFKSILSFLDTLEVKDPYEQCVQYDSIKAGIQAHAETYSFNIESNLFNQLTKEQQKLWRKEIEQACVNGGEVGAELARDTRYKENLEVKKLDLDNYNKVKRILSLSFMNFLDTNCPEGKMCLSNGECFDIDKAFDELDFAKLFRYMEKYFKTQNNN